MDDFLNRTTMYKVVLYYLIVLWIVAFVFSFFNLLSFTPISMMISLAILLSASYITNRAFAYVFRVPANAESIYISVFILALIITPALTLAEYIFLGWVGILAMASKYIFAIKHKHVFNPAALAVAVTAFFLNQGASWWIGTISMMPFVFLGGLIIVRKIKRKDLTFSFFIVALFTIVISSLSSGGDVVSTLNRTIFYSPILFFTFFMITDPLTAPSSRFLRILYGIVVGFMFAPAVHIGAFYFTPEIALLSGNIFSYLVSSKKRLMLKLKKIVQHTSDTVSFIFTPDSSFVFKPGQYLEWTLGHHGMDSRGNRRYFTIASSPTEKELHLGVKFYPNGSSFKKALSGMNDDDTIFASQLSGDFVLPRDKKKKLVFIAGGIGITPFRSMIKYLIDTQQKRDIFLIYSNKKETDIVYKNIFDQASYDFGLKTIYTLTDMEDEQTNWNGRRGFIDGKMILEEIKDWRERTFYISGPPSMVSDTEKIIKNLGLSGKQIKTDFFPGFA
ncbi:MAG: oxidoreductase [Candidatus Paceibacterota bacterium]